MEGVLLGALGGSRALRRTRPPMKLSDLDDRMLHLQVNAIEQSTVKGYATGARDYISFCMSHHLSIEPTPETLAH